MTVPSPFSCHVSGFEVPASPAAPTAQTKWLAVATAHYYDAGHRVPGLTPAQVVLTGEAMRVVEGRAYGDSVEDAMVTALRALFFQLRERASSSDTGQGPRRDPE